VKASPRRLAWLSGVVVACGGGGSGPGPAPARLTAATGNDQIGVAGEPLGMALGVTVRDAAGNPLPGIRVAWEPAGGGSVDPASSLTGGDGQATTIRTLGPGAGPQSVAATVSGLTPVLFNHTAQIQGATEILAGTAVSRSDSVKTTVPFFAVVHDQNGTPVAGVVVSWAAAGGGAVSRTKDTTDASGRTTVTLTLSALAGAQSARADVPGLIGAPVTFVDSATAGAPVQLSKNGGGFQVAPVFSSLPVQHSVLVRDAYGNPTGAVPVLWRVGDGGGLVNGMPGVSTPTTTFGIAAVTRTLGAAAGAQSDTAMVAGLAGSPVVFTDTAGALFTIQVGNGFFSPQHDTVPAGSFLKFVWVSGGTLHNVTWDSSDPVPLPPNSPNESALNASFTERVLGVGDYRYYCSFHSGTGAGVSGVVVSR
jgi:plastocyanin